MVRSLNCSHIKINTQEFFLKGFNPIMHIQKSEIKLQNIYAFVKIFIAVRPEKRHLLYLLLTTRWQ